ncbi:MAG TPA: transcriptional repressor [Rhodospirillales bacterium]|nr:transcriptional repressor [Rhodospirillales bacterium]
MTLERPYSRPLKQLNSVGLRPTSQRMIIAKILFDGTDKHVTAEMLHYEVLKSQKKVSLATVYNTLHLFTELGLLREIIVASDCSYFDTNTSNHYHFYHEDTRELIDIHENDIRIDRLPTPPEGSQITRVDVVVKVGKKSR